MKTGCFKTHTAPGGISIARRAPRGFSGPSYPKLAPGPWFRTAAEARYRELYGSEVLLPLDPARGWAELNELAGGFEPVLLCWVKPPFAGSNFCHRRMAAEWLASALGIDIPEAAPPARRSLFRDDR